MSDGKYEWNVRVIKTKQDFAEYIISADTAEDAEAQVDPNNVPDGMWNGDGWQTTEKYIDQERTERMDHLFPDDYINPDEQGMVLSEYEQGFLEATSHYLHADLVEHGMEEEEWIGVKVGDKVYDLNFFTDECTDVTKCVVHPTKMSGEHRATIGTVFKQLW